MPKKNYELTYLLSPNLVEDEKNSFSAAAVNLVQEKRGLVFESSTPKKIGLAYPIKKETAAWLQTIYFSLDPEKLQDLEKGLKENKEVLRHLILATEKEKRRKMPRQSLRPAVPSTPLLPKVELQDIQKKLDEMLK